MLFNDLSARDLQLATPQWMPGKVFDGSAPCGPALVTPDEAGGPDEISFALELNGERMQEASTSDLIFSVGELITRLSRWMTLEPGDIVSTGTPAGIGAVRDPPVWLKPGDEIVISSPTLGELHTTIA
jgi:2-keto-4-pentenoate hydratase/2-oxohepta-3-ene-1,7-dioic acid hydratase in catechol pathway